jgi:hypothetical protein
MMLGFKFQLLSNMEGFYIYSTLKCIHSCPKASRIEGMRGVYRTLRPGL